MTESKAGLDVMHVRGWDGLKWSTTYLQYDELELLLRGDQLIMSMYNGNSYQISETHDQKHESPAAGAGIRRDVLQRTTFQIVVPALNSLSVHLPQL